MIGVAEKLPAFKVVGVKSKFNHHEENGESAFETLTQDSFPGKWNVIFFYPKDGPSPRSPVRTDCVSRRSPI